MAISSKTALQMFYNLSTSVMLFDKNLSLTCINSAGESLLSVSNRRIIGQTPEEILPYPPALAEMITRTLNTGHPYTERSLTLTLQNAHTITVDCKVTPIQREKRVKEIIVEMVDADSLHRLMREENLMLLHDAARECLRGMAHEIKNPLGGIRGAAQLLERELAESDSGLVEYTRIIIQEADRLRSFIARSLPIRHVDRGQGIQAVLNIMRNAVQATGDNGNIWIRSRILRQVTLHKRIYRHAVRGDIIDDGPGIQAEIENGSFYPMVTSRPEGTGLGLSIAQSLINAHGGIIEYERTDERTIFSVYLPTEQDHA